MILSYSRDQFVPAIKEGIKKHTIRADPKRRWKAGMKIQHWRGNPRNVRQNPYQFGVGECKGVQEIRIYRGPQTDLHIEVDGRDLSHGEMVDLMENDGLTPEQFIRWFIPNDQEFTGRIIHFTELMY